MCIDKALLCCTCIKGIQLTSDCKYIHQIYMPIVDSKMNANEIQCIALYDWSVRYYTGITRIIVYNHSHVNKNHLYSQNIRIKNTEKQYVRGCCFS